DLEKRREPLVPLRDAGPLRQPPLRLPRPPGGRPGAPLRAAVDGTRARERGAFRSGFDHQGSRPLVDPPGGRRADPRRCVRGRTPPPGLEPHPPRHGARLPRARARSALRTRRDGARGDRPPPLSIAEATTADEAPRPRPAARANLLRSSRARPSLARARRSRTRRGGSRKPLRELPPAHVRLLFLRRNKPSENPPCFVPSGDPPRRGLGEAESDLRGSLRQTERGLGKDGRHGEGRTTTGSRSHLEAACRSRPGEAASHRGAAARPARGAGRRAQSTNARMASNPAITPG